MLEVLPRLSVRALRHGVTIMLVPFFIAMKMLSVLSQSLLPSESRVFGVLSSRGVVY